MTDQKPGCIHPGDPEGCIGGFMYLTALIILAAITIALCIAGTTGMTRIPTPTVTPPPP
jgi:hypothetical protein